MSAEAFAFRDETARHPVTCMAPKASQVALIRTAVPLTEAQQEMILQRLGDKVGQRLQALFEVDAALLGGVQARVGDELIDNSIAARLAELREVLAKSEK